MYAPLQRCQRPFSWHSQRRCHLTNSVPCLPPTCGLWRGAGFPFAQTESRALLIPCCGGMLPRGQFRCRAPVRARFLGGLPTVPILRGVLFARDMPGARANLPYAYDMSSGAALALPEPRSNTWCRSDGPSFLVPPGNITLCKGDLPAMHWPVQSDGAVRAPGLPQPQ